MYLSDTAALAIRKNNRCIGRLITAFNRGQNTIENWLNANPKDIRLTTPIAVNIIMEETGLTESEILVAESSVEDKANTVA